MPKTDYTKPIPVNLSWTVSLDKGSINEYKVLLSEKSDLTDAREYKANSTSIDVTNLKLDTTYYYQVSYKGFKSNVYSFKTNNTVIRGIDVDGVKNVRDLGGFFNLKQGMLYRGGEFESYDKYKDTLTTLITEKGKQTIKNELGIKTEVDLRKNDNDSKENGLITKSSVDGLNYVQLPMYYGGENLIEYRDDTFDDPARIKDFFELLANENNYPVYFHCSQGKDRTGILAYLVTALLGASKDNLYKDYLYSNLADISYDLKMSGIDGKYGGTLDEYHNTLPEGTTFAEAVYKYLNEVIGVSTQNLDSVISLLEIK